MFVGKCYVDGGMFKFHVIANKPNFSELDNFSAYLLKSSNMWHDRHGHVNLDTIRRLIKLEHIPHFHISQNMDATHVLNQS